MARWIIELATTAGGDYDFKRTADSPGEAAEVCRRLLAGETWSRLLSAYVTLRRVRLWIITEASDDAGWRAATTLLLPDEY